MNVRAVKCHVWNYTTVWKSPPLPYVSPVKAIASTSALKGTEVLIDITLGLVLFMSCMKDHKLLVTVNLNEPI